MPLGTLTILSVVAAQIGAAGINYIKSRGTQSKIAELQKEYERTTLENNFDRAVQKRNEMQKLREANDLDAHNFRLRTIQNNYSERIKIAADAAALGNWPLIVPPFVMKDESIGFLGESNVINNSTIPLHCIMGKSSDKNFNRIVFPLIESRLSETIYQHWGAESLHTILFYSGACKDNQPLCTARINNMQYQLNDLPVLVITPHISNDKDGINFYYYISLWGINGNETRTDFEYLPESVQESCIDRGYSYRKDAQYTEDEIDAIVKEQVEALSLFIGYIADMYYWNYYRITPILPTLKYVSKQASFVKEIEKLYIDAYREFIKDNINILLPTDSVKLLNSLKPIFSDNSFQDELSNLVNLCLMMRKSIESSASISEILLLDNIFDSNDSIFLSEISKTYNPVIKDFYIDKSLSIPREEHNIMDNVAYHKKRDELIELINDTVEIENLPVNSITKFEQLKKKCLENQFRVTLIGEFQGGKSTTFNALCGGREISPRGAMLKTSACKISATNISNPNEQEHAHVQWKTNQELLLNINTILNKYINKCDTNYTAQNELAKEVYEPYMYLDLSNEVHHALIKDAVQQEWQAIRTNGESWVGQIDVCRIADIILSFHKNEYIKEITSKNNYNIEDVSLFAVFPNNWEVRWEELEKIDIDIISSSNIFKANEVIFAFVNSIDCHIHSSNLERLGCTIVDCPGLFASSWDTEVAMNALSNTDAAIYLLSGSKQLSEGDKRAFVEIRKIDKIDKKIFFVINTRESESITNNIFNTNKTLLERAGFSEPRLLSFNALLFFLYEFGLKYTSGTIDNFSIDRFNDIANKFGQKGEIEKIWLKSIQKSGYTLDFDDLTNIEDISNDSLDIVAQHSNYKTTLNEIENFIVCKASQSILIDQGAVVIRSGLIEYEKDLQRIESEINKELTEIEAQYQKDKISLETFKDNVQKLLESAFPENTIHNIASRAYNKIIRQKETIEGISINTSVKIIPILGFKFKSKAAKLQALKTTLEGAKFLHLNTLSNSLKSDIEELTKDIKSTIEPVINEAIREVVAPKISQWVTTFFDNSNDEYLEEFAPKIKQLLIEIKQKWGNAVANNPSIIDYELSINQPSDIPSVYGPSITLEDDKKITDGVVSSAVSSAIREIINTIIGIVIFIVVWFVLEIIFTGGLITLIALILKLSTAFAYGQSGDKRTYPITDPEKLTKDEKKIYSPLYLELSGKFNDDTAVQKITDAFKSVPLTRVKSVKDYVKDLLKGQEDRLEKRINNSREKKRNGIEKQKKSAEEAKKIRENQIVPMLKRINEFIKLYFKTDSNNE